MTKLALLLATAAALMAFSPVAMAQSNTSANGGGIILAQTQVEPMQGQTANPPGDYEAPDTMPTYQKNDGTDKE